MKFVYYQSKANNHWYWRLVARNGKTIADGAEDYEKESGILKAIGTLSDKFAVALKVVKIDSPT